MNFNPKLRAMMVGTVVGFLVSQLTGSVLWGDVAIVVTISIIAYKDVCSGRV